jgi:hypothetical protein
MEEGMMNEATNALGAAMRKEADANNHCTREIGTLFLRMTRYGGDWALELNDETPIDDATAQTWAQAAGVPDGTKWRKTAHGKVWRCEWRESGYGEPLPPRGFWLGR